jgi:RNA polymerase sigma factor for flagellar operon FliA
MSVPILSIIVGRALMSKVSGRSVASGDDVGCPSSKPDNISVTAPGDRDALVEEYYDYVSTVVYGLMRTMQLPGAMREEFLSAGLFGLVEAAGRFDPERGEKFKTFAFLRIRGAVIDYVRSTCELSPRAYRRLRALEAAQMLREEQLTRRGGAAANSCDTRETAAKEGLEYLERVAVAFKLLGHEGDEEARIAARERFDPESNLQKKRRSERIRELVATLPEKERIIIEQHYFHDRKFVEVAEQFAGLSKSWVSRLHDKAIDMLRQKIQKVAPDLAA